MAKNYIEVDPYKSYNWINLPQDAVIDKLELNNSNRVKIHYSSESKEIHISDENLGFEYYTFREGQNIQIIISKNGEEGKAIYSNVLELNEEKILIVICKWAKK